METAYRQVNTRVVVVCRRQMAAVSVFGPDADGGSRDTVPVADHSVVGSTVPAVALRTSQDHGVVELTEALVACTAWKQCLLHEGNAPYHTASAVDGGPVADRVLAAEHFPFVERRKPATMHLLGTVRIAPGRDFLVERGKEHCYVSDLVLVDLQEDHTHQVANPTKSPDCPDRSADWKSGHPLSGLDT